MIQNMESVFFKPLLQTRSYVAFAITKCCACLARQAECSSELIGKDSTDDGGALLPGDLDAFTRVAKVVEVEREAAARFGANDVAKLFHEPRTAIRGQSHQFPFVSVMRKAEELCRGGVNDARGVRILHLPEHLNRISFTHTAHRRDEITETINR